MKRIFFGRELNVQVDVGHRSGALCLVRSKPVAMTILHTNGLHELNVRFCECTESKSRTLMLLEMSWWPATNKDPHTAATWEVLRLFHMLNMRCKTNATDFYESLELLTDAWGLSTGLCGVSTITCIQYPMLIDVDRVGDESLHAWPINGDLSRLTSGVAGFRNGMGLVEQRLEN